MNAEQQVRYLQIELEKARAEATRLRKALGENSKHARRVDKAYEDALLLATFYVAGILPSRRFARIQGISQNRWENALALLKMARVVERHRKWVMQDLATIEKRLAIARDKALEDVELFFLRANSHCRRGHSYPR